MLRIDTAQDSIVALSTPPGIGALGLIRLSGPDVINIINPIFKGVDLAEIHSHTVHFGQIIEGKQNIIDEALLSFFKGPHSFTGEDTIELSCHGSPYILKIVLDLCVAQGARLAQPGEFTQRAFLNKKLDLSQAEAVADVIASENAAMHHIAIQQLKGKVSTEIKGLREELIHFASLVELELDFSEEDVEFADRTKLITLVDTIQKHIAHLLDSFNLGNAIKKGVNTVIVGRPNAGKSTLLNALLQEERAIVSAIPGTTRDTIEEILHINDIAFRFIDTAGIREAQDEIESIGVQRTFSKIKDAAIVLYVYDVNTTTQEEVVQDIQAFQATTAQLYIVANKIDLLATELQHNHIQTQFPDFPIIGISAQNNTQLDNLKQHIVQPYLTGLQQHHNIILSNARHAEALNNANLNLTSAKQQLIEKVSGEWIAQNIRMAIYHLGSITGEISSDDLLGAIFSRFCIGK